MVSSGPPLVSVIIPTHNRAHVVPETIDSVLAQSHEAIEVIVVDDGSTDGTPEVLRERYGTRIRVVSQENAGVEAARRHGKNLATGEFVNFLDDDDLMYRDKIARQLAIFARRPRAGVVHCWYDYVGEHGEYLQTARLLPEGDVRIPLTYGCFPWSGGPLIRRECLDVIADDEHRDWYGDWGMWLRIALAGYSFECARDALGAYRMLPGSMTDALVRNVERLVLNVLGSVFAIGNVPNDDVESRRLVYSGWHAWIAFRYYAGGHFDDGARNLEAAVSLRPALRTDGRRLAGLVVTDAVTPRMRLQDPRAFVDSVFDHLPPAARAAAPHRRWALAATLLQAAVSEFGAGRRDAGAERLSEAIAIDPGIAADVRRFAGIVARHARSLPRERHDDYLREVFESLPPDASALQKARATCAARIALARAVELRRQGRRGHALAEISKAAARQPGLAAAAVRRVRSR